MIRPFHGFAPLTLAITLGCVAGCASIPSGDPAVAITARAETVPVGTVNEDAADDPAIWYNSADPSKSLIVGTDKKAGLHVYNLEGKQISFLKGAGLNNVDLAEMEDGTILVAASDRRDLTLAHVLIASLDPATGELSEMGRFAVGPGEGYGICMGKPSGMTVPIFSAPKNGRIYRLDLSLDAAAEQTSTQIASVPSQPEGCVVDTRKGTLYVGEEATGIWAIDIETGSKSLVAEVGTGMLVADVEGLALAAEAEDGGYLVASSQGDNAFAVYTLPGMEPLGRFRIAQGDVGSAEETDGIALDSRSFGEAFPGGLFVAQDGINPPSAQNFKLVRWDDILAGLKSVRTQS